ncbi:transmembrane protein, putative (macronuclear) [Tetrahymena thermophila SB210]|uniref:Transmembrane protein, putative n=1 Tax=Tetrahymena thermophila (strain SB210) TaxID=312017 RepID=Q23RG0_TETTS|nr:transmembrane protein, putative [Tetrahymena thermophila SB210]EAR99088.2 transmembrane protein, putative [Tetrahymena thermophila SB210]|eukprot:XP_001019333.2 transmembrane protein, putative [Tetrahymena thermophila SB210]
MDIIAMGSLGSKKLITHLVLVLVAIIVERIAQVVYYLLVIRVYEIQKNIQSNLNLTQHIIFRALFLDIFIFLKSNYQIKNQTSGQLLPCVSHRTFVSYQTQNIHSYFSTFACLFFQSHGMIYWGSSDPILIISMVVHFICLAISNTTTYVQESNIKFVQIFTKNILYIISFIGFWCLTSNISRPRFLVAHMFACIIILIIIYVLYTSTQVQPADIQVINQKQNLEGRQNIQKNNEILIKNGEINKQQAGIDNKNQNLDSQPQNRFQVQNQDISSINNNPEQSKQQINKQFQQSSKKQEDKDTYETHTPQQMTHNASDLTKNIHIPQANTAEKISLNNNINQIEDIHIEQFDQNVTQNKHIQNTDFNITENNHTHLNSGRDALQSKINSNMDYMSHKGLIGYGFKEHLPTEGENNDYVIKFDDDSQNTQKIKQLASLETPKQSKYQDQQPSIQVHQPTEIPTQNDQNYNKNTQKSHDQINQDPKSQNQEFLKPIEVQHNENLLIQHEPQIVSKMSIEEEKEVTLKNTKKDIILYHIQNILGFVICGFFMCMNYEKDFFVMGKKYLNKPLSSFKIINIVFLFTFEISFNSFHFFPALRVISIICGCFYLLIEIQYLIKFDYKSTFIYEIIKKFGKKQPQKKNQQANQIAQNVYELPIKV